MFPLPANFLIVVGARTSMISTFQDSIILAFRTEAAEAKSIREFVPNLEVP